ncbi:secreted protein [Pelomyxa schiedti]|nr:secreted protein [Pelomyxa schiedti]
MSAVGFAGGLEGYVSGTGSATTGTRRVVQAKWCFFDRAWGYVQNDESVRDNGGQNEAKMLGDGFFTPEGLMLDGQGQLEVPLVVSLDNYAFSIWFKTTTTTCGLCEAFEAGHDRHLYIRNGRLGARVWNDETITTPSGAVNVCNGEWHNVVHTFGGDVGGQRIYIDGALSVCGSKSKSDFNWQKVFHIGFSSDCKPKFVGVIATATLYSTALNDSDVSALYETERYQMPVVSNIPVYVRPELPALQARWDFSRHCGEVMTVSDYGNVRTNVVGDVIFSADGLFLQGGGFLEIPMIISLTAYTFSCWIKTTSNNGGICEAAKDGHDRHVFLHNGHVSARLWDNESISTESKTTYTKNVCDGKWHQILYMFGGQIGGQRIYVDGMEIVAGTKTSSDFNWQSVFHIGFSSDATPNYFSGFIDQVCVYRKTFSEQEIMREFCDQKYDLRNTLKETDISFPDIQAAWEFGNCAMQQTTVTAKYGTITATAVGHVEFRPWGLVLDGTAYMEAPAIVSTTSYAFSCWIRTRAQSGGICEAFHEGHDRHIFLSNGKLCSRVWNNETIRTAAGSFSDGNWHHIVHTFGGCVGGQRLYVDGELVAQGSKSASDFNWQKSFRIGTSSDCQAKFHGVIEFPTIFRKALAQAEIQRIFHDERSRIKMEFPEEPVDSSTVIQASWNLSQYCGTRSVTVLSQIGDVPATRHGVVSFTTDGMVSTADGFLEAPMVVSLVSYAFSCWIKTANKNGGICEAYERGHDRHVYLNNGCVCARVWNDETIRSTRFVCDGHWHHIVHTYGGRAGGQKLYVDGVQVAEGERCQSDFNWQKVFRIGRSSDSPTGFCGIIDLVKVYQTGLSPDDVMQLYQQERTLKH